MKHVARRHYFVPPAKAGLREGKGLMDVGGWSALLFFE